ncbi:hypothetical protein ACJU26_09170 [Acidithiobacillus sp. M4-SHS-6]|uniref:hypothetical protein n=1 Tax=Acidithiobacillus sp. M4-SHS-6 TaxID=3383024 RepID=UPI0039BDB332
MLNTFNIVGDIVRSEIRKTGAAMIWVRASEREEDEIRGAAIPSFFTPIIAIRIPRYLLEKTAPEVFEKGKNISVTGRLQGVKRMVDGHDYYIVEAQAGFING